MIFIDNKYTKTYFKIINRAKLRLINEYTEKHHIIPKSLGGTNDKNNLVLLTAREHFVCHILLTRMTQGGNKKKMVLAIFKMMGKGKRNSNNIVKSSKIYENLKKQLSKIVSENKKGCKQPPRSLIAKQNYSKSKTGKLNPRFKNEWITPWGIFESTRLAAKSCPTFITAEFILRACQKNNTIPITYLSVCRSKGWLNNTHIGKTPKELGFDIK